MQKLCAYPAGDILSHVSTCEHHVQSTSHIQVLIYASASPSPGREIHWDFSQVEWRLGNGEAKPDPTQCWQVSAVSAGRLDTKDHQKFDSNPVGHAKLWPFRFFNIGAMW